MIKPVSSGFKPVKAISRKLRFKKVLCIPRVKPDAVGLLRSELFLKGTWFKRIDYDMATQALSIHYLRSKAVKNIDAALSKVLKLV